MGSQTSSKTSQKGSCNPLNPPPGSAYAITTTVYVEVFSIGLLTFYFTKGAVS